MISVLDIHWAAIRNWMKELGAAYGGFDLEDIASARKHSSLLPRRFYDGDRVDERMRTILNEATRK